jgi:hypothetical protein
MEQLELKVNACLRSFSHIHATLTKHLPINSDSKISHVVTKFKIVMGNNILTYVNLGLSLD